MTFLVLNVIVGQSWLAGELLHISGYEVLVAYHSETNYHVCMVVFCIGTAS